MLRKNRVSYLLVIVGSAFCLFTTVWAGSADSGDKNYLQAGEKNIQVWRQMKFGIFIHWGPVSLKGTEIGWSRGDQVPVEEYDQLYKQFNPTLFDADTWVTIAKEAGMKYLIITSKHHDGFCLWPSKFTEYNIGNTPFGRDVLKELSDACKRHGLWFCTYYSICDWHHPDYPLGSPGGRSKKPHPNMPRYFEYLKNQTKEIIENYGPLGIMWFDGEWEQPWTQEYGNELYAYLKGIQPDIIINNRVSKGRQGMAGTTQQANQNAGDYDTPEQRIGTFQTERPWETCMTICQQWAWKPNDELKSLKQCIDTLVKVIGGDGNLLLNVGPMPDGRIEPRQVERLKEMGAWLKKYGQSIYATRGGPFIPGAWGASTYKDNTIYVHILNWPGEKLTLPPIPRKIIASSVLTGGTPTISQTNESIEVSVPKDYRQEIDTIIKLDLDGSAREIAPVSLPSASLGYRKKATASNVYQNNPQHGPDKAFDDDPTTRWATDYGVKQAWLEVDLRKPMTFNRIQISEAYDRVRKFELQCKNGGQWKTFAHGSTIGSEYVKDFEPVTAKEVRLNILDATEGPTIWEFQLLAPKK
jgi:alpha-L-fucosidase